MEQKRLRGGVVGFGRMGITHCAILNTHPMVSMVACCDKSAFVIGKFQELTGIRGFASGTQMLDSVDLDFVVVATPTASHYDEVRRALARNLHVFVEKPLTLSCSDSAEISAEAERRGVINQVGYVNRFNASFVATKELLANGVLGTVHHFRCGMSAPTVLKENKGSWRGERSAGGGCLFDFATHGIDLIQFMFGPPDRVAGCATPNVYSGTTEDAVYGTLLYRSGLCGHLSVDWSDASYRKPAYRFECQGSNGRVVADQHGFKLFLRKGIPGSGYVEGWQYRYATDLERPVRFYLRGNEFSNQLDYFIDKVLRRETSNVSGFRSAATTDRIVESIRLDVGSMDSNG